MTNSSLSDDNFSGLQYMVLTVVATMMFVGIVGNLIVCYIYHFRWPHNTVALVKMMFAAIDMACLILAYPALLFVTSRVHSDYYQNVCRMFAFVLVLAFVTTGLILVLIAVDRYLKLCRLSMVGVDRKLSVKLALLGLLTASVFSLPTPWLFGHEGAPPDCSNSSDFDGHADTCFISNDANRLLLAFWGSAIWAIILILSIAFVYLYVLIVRKMRNLSKKYGDLTGCLSMTVQMRAKDQRKHDEYMTHTIQAFIVISVVYILSYAPFFAPILLHLSSQYSYCTWLPTAKVWMHVAELCPLVCCVANPFIYCFESKYFRREFKRLLALEECGQGFCTRRNFSTPTEQYEFYKTSTTCLKGSRVASSLHRTNMYQGSIS